MPNVVRDAILAADEDAEQKLKAMIHVTATVVQDGVAMELPLQTGTNLL